MCDLLFDIKLIELISTSFEKKVRVDYRTILRDYCEKQVDCEFIREIKVFGK